jgi:hypothetical protein
MHRAGAAGRRRARRLSGRSLRSAGWGWHLSRLGCWHLDRCHQLRDHCRESAGSAHQKLRGFWECITANPWRNSFEWTNGPTGDAARARLNQLHAGLAVKSIGAQPSDQDVAASLSQSAESWGMPVLTGRRNPDARQESWLIHYGDVHVGTIGLRLGQPLRHGSMAMALRLLSGL